MLAEATYELFVRETHLHSLCTFPIVLVAESNLAVIQADEPMIANSNLMCVAAQILHYRFRVLERPLCVYYPRCFKQAGKEGSILLREFPSQTSHEPGPEDLAHGLDRKEELTFIPSRLPFALHGHPSTGHNAMQVRMKGQVLAPGMEHSDHGRLGPQVLWIFGKALHHRPGSTEEQAINLSRRIQA